MAAVSTSLRGTRGSRASRRDGLRPGGGPPSLAHNSDQPESEEEAHEVRQQRVGGRLRGQPQRGFRQPQRI